MIAGVYDVEAARERIEGTVRVTPLVPSDAISARARVPTWLKLESMQVTGSFKARGASNRILGLGNNLIESVVRFLRESFVHSFHY